MWSGRTRRAGKGGLCGAEQRERGVETEAGSIKYEPGTYREPLVMPSRSVKPKDFSDAGAAEIFAQRVKDRLLRCDSLGWLVWDGKRYDANEHAATALAIKYAQELSRCRWIPPGMLSRWDWVESFTASRSRKQSSVLIDSYSASRVMACAGAIIGGLQRFPAI